MSGIAYSLAGAAIVFVLVRRIRGRQWRGGGAAALGTFVQRHSPLGDTGLVAMREVRERLRGRVFKVTTVILLVVVAAAIVIPTLHSSSRSVTKVGVVGALSPSEDRAVLLAAKSAGVTARLVAEPDVGKGRAALDAGLVTLIVDNARAVYVRTALGSGASTTTATAATTIASDLGVDEAFRSAGVTPRQEDVIAHARPLAIRGLHHAAKGGAARTTSLVGVILVFIMLTQYLTWTLMGVLEEKTSRVVEVLLATVRPVQLLGGKLLGIGLAALLQAGLVVAFALILADAVGSDLLRGTAPLAVVASLVWLVLGYGFYSWVYAAAGSMAARQDQVQSLALPLSVPIIFGYIVALSNAEAATPSLLVKVLAYLPPTAPFAMPLLVAKGSATLWEFLLAAALSVAATVVVARLAAGIYRRAVLRGGTRLRLRELIASGR